MKRYCDLLLEQQKITDRLTLLDRVIANGVPKGIVHHYVTPDLSSGYSMGETVVMACNGQVFDVKDQTREYAKSCKWRARHGRVVVDMTKKQLRRYVELLARGEQGDSEAEKEISALVKGCIKNEISIVK